MTYRLTPSESFKWRVLPAALIAGGVFVSPAQAQSDPARKDSKPAAAAATPARSPSPYRPVSVPKRARSHYIVVAGIDDLKVRRTASDNLIRFSYRVTDPDRAKVLSDK